MLSSADVLTFVGARTSYLAHRGVCVCAASKPTCDAGARIRRLFTPPNLIDSTAAHVELSTLARGERIKIKRTVYVLALVIFTSSCVCSADAQTNRRGTNTSAVPGALAALPASDAVMTVDVQRLYKEALPRIYASDPAKLAEINSDIETFKTRTGLDPRAFERVAVGVRVVQTPLGMIKLQSVAIARGTFSAAALVAAGRIAAKGGYQEQQYKGKTIYLFNLGQQVKFLGLRWTNLAVVVLDANTLAFGQPERVRAAVDALGGGARVAADVVALAQHDPNAIIGMGGN